MKECEKEMNNYDLSVIIPARNEMFLSQTVENILQNIKGNTEIIVVLDGAWADPGVPEDPRVTILYNHESIGQRASTNQAVRLSRAKYVMKIDAHCAVDTGFDVKMMKEMKDHYTMIPTMYNLHAFDWVCYTCGYRQYQGRTPHHCEKCKTKGMAREIIWKPRESRKSNYYRFDKSLHFQYWRSYDKRPEAQGDVVPIMSAQGSCFMLTRERYIKLNMSDEAHGSWGQQGVEVALKSWSDGELVVNKKTWYAHMFRTQGGDFGFPYKITGREQEKAREYSRKLWLESPVLKKVLEMFYPVPDWHEGVEDRKLTKEVIYYTDGELDKKDPELADRVRNQLKRGIKGKHIIGVTLNEENEKVLEQEGLKQVLNLSSERGYLTMAKQILAGLEASTADIIYFAEHDMLYHPSHFAFIPPRKDRYYYNTNVWRVRKEDGHSLWCDDLKQLSGMVAYRDTLIKHYKERVKMLQHEIYTGNSENFSRFVRKMGHEPGTHGRPERVDDIQAESFMSAFPNLDIRHDHNATPSRWTKEEFRNERYTKGWRELHVNEIPGWEDLALL